MSLQVGLYCIFKCMPVNKNSSNLHTEAQTQIQK